MDIMNYDTQVFFAVTDQGFIIPIKKKVGSEIVMEDEFIILETELVEESNNSHVRGQFKFHFSTLWFDEDNKPLKGTVFKTEGEAKRHVLDLLTSTLDRKEKEVEELKKQIAELN